MKREVGLTDAQGYYLPLPRQPQGRGMKWNVPDLEGVFALLFLDGEPYHSSSRGVRVREGVLEIDWSRHDEQPTRFVNNGHELWDSAAIEAFQRAVENFDADVHAFNDAMDEFIASEPDTRAIGTQPDDPNAVEGRWDDYGPDEEDGPWSDGYADRVHADRLAGVDMADFEVRVIDVSGPDLTTLDVTPMAVFVEKDEPVGRLAGFLRKLMGRQ